jgi:homoserine dehydrogenase
MHYRLALLGFGNVGRAFARLLLDKEEELEINHGIIFIVTGIATGRHGIAINPEGLDLERALATIESGESIETLTRLPVTDTLDFVNSVPADVLFENSPVNHENGEPAASYLRIALERGMHAVTANKGPVVHAHRELSRLAQSKGRRFLFESTVMDGAPIFSLFRSSLPATRLISFRGILNSTSNMILGRMESGEDFEQAVRYTQSIGLAETDPAADIDGWDASIKVAALVTVLMGVPIKLNEVARTGIRGISMEQIAQAKSEGKRWKLVCTASREGEKVRARVTPELVDASSPLYTVEGSSSIVEFHTDTLSSLSVVEGNPGPETTAYGLLADFINVVRKM